MGDRALSAGVAALAGLAAVLAGACSQEAVVVRIDRAVKHQTIHGWGANPEPVLARFDEPLRETILDLAVDELGLTRLRLEPGRMWEPRNDDDDPEHIEWSRIDTDRVDGLLDTVIVPFRERVLERGDPFELYVSPTFADEGRTGRVPEWLLESPAEYAEYVESLITHVKHRAGFEPTSIVLVNEPGHGNPFKPNRFPRLLQAVGARLDVRGFTTGIQYPEALNPTAARRYARVLDEHPEAWKRVDTLSWHLYGERWRAERPELAALAREKGIRTAQTEYMDATARDLFEDLTLGDVSVWEYFGLAHFGDGPREADAYLVDYGEPTIHRTPQYWRLRQVFRYVRPGDVRIGTEVSGEKVLVAAFEGPRGVTVCLWNPPGGERRLRLSGLPPGTYDVTAAVDYEPARRLAVLHVTESVDLALPSSSVVTITPGAGAAFFTEARGVPGRLRDPDGAVQLLARHVGGGELTWHLSDGPGNVLLFGDADDETRMKGFDRPGLYRFTARLTDGGRVLERDAFVRFEPGNLAPVVGAATNRRPVRPRLPESSTHVGVEAHDPDGDELNYSWSIVSAPPGAHPRFDPLLGQDGFPMPIGPGGKLVGLTVAGDYLIAVEVSDGKSSVRAELALFVLPADPDGR